MSASSKLALASLLALSLAGCAGNPYAEHTGANWASKTHIDCVGRDFDIWFNGQQVMREGKFLI